MTFHLSLELREPPRSIDSLPFVDAAILCDRITKRREASARWQAALAGKEVRH